MLRRIREIFKPSSQTAAKEANKQTILKQHLLLIQINKKNFKENTENKNNKLSQGREKIVSKTPKLKHPNKKHTAKHTLQI